MYLDVVAGGTRFIIGQLQKVFLFNSVEDVDLHIGSYFGVTNFFQGVMSEFKIGPYDIYTLYDDEWTGVMSNTCPFGFWRDNSGCSPCHES